MNNPTQTTLLRALSRLLLLAEGSIAFEGRDIGSEPAHRVARADLVHVPRVRQIIPNLSVEDNLRIGAGSLPKIGKEEVQAMLEREFEHFPMLHKRRAIPGSSLSGGLMMRPKLLMLDETSFGLASQVVTATFATLRDLARGGMAVLAGGAGRLHGAEDCRFRLCDSERGYRTVRPGLARPRLAWPGAGAGAGCEID